MLKLIGIVFAELDQYLPKDIRQAFERTASILRKYFKNKPHGEIEQEEQHDYRIQYDQVQQFLDNKPEILTNDEERGELFKFLTMNEQKQKNTQILLESMPRYSCDYPYHQLQSNNYKNPPSNIESIKAPTLLPEIKGNLKNGISSPFKVHSKLSHNDKRHSVETKEDETQTDLTLSTIKQILARYGSQSIDNAKQTCDFATEMTDFLQNMVIEATQKENHKTTIFEQTKEEQAFSKNEPQQNQNEPNNSPLETKANHARTSVTTSSKKITTKEQPSPKPTNLKPKKTADKRESSNSLSSSKKDLLKGISAKKASNRSSKDLKEGNRPTNQSKFSKERKDPSPSRYIATILETTQELVPSHEISPMEQQIRPSEASNNDTATNPAETIAGESQEGTTFKKHSKKSTQEREKIASNKEEISHSDFLIEQAYACTADHPFYRKTEKENENTLPKIDEKGKLRQDRVESLKKKIYQSSPYAKALLQADQRQLKYSNSSIQLNHRSLHINPSDTHSFLSPKDNNLKYQKTELTHEGYDYKSQSSTRFDFPRYVDSQKQGILREEHMRMVREIEQSVGKRAQPQWSKVLRSIRHYELMHANLCGENCVHLSKFYEFLRRKNLGSCINRKELLLHKKNIEITAAIHQ